MMQAAHLLDNRELGRVRSFVEALVDQQAARVLIEPNRRGEGFWFGGGNMAVGPDRSYYLTGRYRNAGDSRTGLGMGERGLELAVFRAEDEPRDFRKVLSFSKSDLSTRGRKVLSIEGSALLFGASGVELYVSSEKESISYPEALARFQKPGTGVWTIDRMYAATVDELDPATMTTVLSSEDPQFLHVKDPFVSRMSGNRVVLGFSTHPFNWASSNGGYAIRREAGQPGAGGEPGAIASAEFHFFPRGYTWDAGISRPTALLPLPRVGPFDDVAAPIVLFYDGGECMRNLDEHARAAKRPRGYSCEELGGAAIISPDLRYYQRLDVVEPMFVSPMGTGCSRYVDVLTMEDMVCATWQQSQEDRSQPLVLNALSRTDAERLLLG